MKIPPQTFISIGRKKLGFSLIITVTMLVLLSLIAVGLLSLSATTLRSSSHDRVKAEARANARMALMLALGELQKHAGPDQRITAPAAISGTNVANPNWTGIWNNEKKNEEPVWLVSGGSLPSATTTPNSNLSQGDSVVLFKQDPVDGQSGDEVRVPKMAVFSDGQQTGGYSWWIADEGSKGRIDLDNGDGSVESEQLRIAHALSLNEVGVSALGNELEQLRGREGVDRNRILTNKSLDLVSSGEASLSRRYFHSLTTGGAGLPVDVVDGGFKQDLSVVFDSSQLGKSHVEEVTGMVPSKSSRARDYSIRVQDAEKFYLSKQLSRNGAMPVGPNWGILYNYGQLWQRVGNHEMDVVGLLPAPRCEMRKNNWAPYTNSNTDQYGVDKQHYNTSVAPVISMAQMGFRVSAERIGRGYQLQLQMKPVIGIWNPYNVKLRADTYRFLWALYPFIRLGTSRGAGHTEIYMREEWKKGGTSDRGVNGGHDKYFSMNTPSIDLEPGERRFFSVADNPVLGQENELVPTWNEKGAFIFNLSYSNVASDVLPQGKNPGDPLILPSNSEIWIGNMFLEDTQWGKTERHFNLDYAQEGVSASWFALNSSRAVIHRVPDLWHTAREGIRGSEPFNIPENINGLYTQTGGATTSTKYFVSSLATTPYHVGTWRWQSRTVLDGSNSKDRQGLRGWIDTNPRFVTNNPKWDGSRWQGENFEGWHSISPLIGGSYDLTYDDGPSARGKVAEDMNTALATPPSQLRNGRYLGFHGFSDNTEGQTHVAIYDVPRTPLISLGQFQHAQLSRYGYEPGYVMGNSYANSRIPLDSIVQRDFAGIKDFSMTDIAYEVNEALWDKYFFSTIGADYYKGSPGGAIDDVLPMDKVVSGESPLANPRYEFIPRSDDEGFQQILDDSNEEAAVAISTRMRIKGAFNVNSTSVDAWKALLSSMEDLELPTVSTSGVGDWENTGDVRFPRFGHPVDGGELGSTGDPGGPGYWQSYRKLSSSELEELAKEIVAEIQNRGPFRSFSEFVNRDPEAQKEQHQKKGCLQSALDRVINVPDGVGNIAQSPQGSSFHAVMDGETEAAGYPGYLLQGDLLQTLAPVLQVRSDYFRVRAAGDATDANGRVLYRAYCEVFVQRLPDYVDGEDSPETMRNELESQANKVFGRQFAVSSFRWLNEDEV